MIKFKQKLYFLQAMANVAMIGGSAGGLLQGSEANEAQEEAAKKAQKEQNRHDREMEEIAKSQGIEQKDFANVGSILKGIGTGLKNGVSDVAKQDSVIGKTTGMAKDFYGIHKDAIKKTAGMGASFAALGYAGNRLATSIKDHDEGHDEKNGSFLGKAALGAATIGGGILAAKHGLLGKPVKNFMSKEGTGGKALSSLGKSMNPIAKNAEGGIDVKGTLTKNVMNGVFLGMPVLSYEMSKKSKEDLQGQQENSQEQYSEIPSSIMSRFFSDQDENKGMSTGAKIGLGLGATAATLGGAFLGAKSGWFGQGARQWAGNTLAGTGSLLKSHGLNKLGKRFIKSGSNTYGDAKATLEAAENKMSENSIAALKKQYTNERTRKALQGVDIGQNVTGGINHASSFVGMFGKGGTEAVQNTAKKLSQGNSEYSRKLGDWMQEHKKSANLLAAGGTIAAGGAAMGLGDSLVNKPLKVVDKHAYDMENEQEGKVE